MVDAGGGLAHDIPPLVPLDLRYLSGQGPIAGILGSGSVTGLRLSGKPRHFIDPLALTVNGVNQPGRPAHVGPSQSE